MGLLRIEKIKISELIYDFYCFNGDELAAQARQRSSENWPALVDSVKQRGIVNPLVVMEIKDENYKGAKGVKGKYAVMIGNTMLTIAKDLGIKEVWCGIMSDHDVKETRKFVRENYVEFGHVKGFEITDKQFY